MSHNFDPSASLAELHRASHWLVGASWQAASFFSDVALQMMTASTVGIMLLMAAACSMYAIATALLHLDGSLR
ncbi:hypothetical protein CupriaWKF_30280 [Cupriavidus sp. WKF15]|uniref:hypothetical protein n=1 Tax=Cupriavidus sp. WKF15 TaxID=3032282 RepID=UPI0023E284C2|nr:hypothetical protein [Cupriavidus sp. WKF15]WER50658.1 hypothetical protein CupriaWKF_30280 [Cupriavidus sp. WKF15]